MGVKVSNEMMMEDVSHRLTMPLAAGKNELTLWNAREDVADRMNVTDIHNVHVEGWHDLILLSLSLLSSSLHPESAGKRQWGALALSAAATF